jgi:hypothetical protein
MKQTVETYPDGSQEWHLNGELHREDGPAIIVIGSDGSKYWYNINDKLHREDGPAITRPNGSKWWYINGNRHREDGPAYIGPSGTKEWWLNGKRITQEVNNWAKERNIDLNNMSDEDNMILKTEIKMWK